MLLDEIVGPVIVVVEGPSAAGKTTWAAAKGGASLVSEPARTVEPPGEPAAVAKFWTDRHAERWSQALARERQTGLAVLDTDPLKLHYSWSLQCIDAASREQWENQERAYREAIAAHRIGFADRYLVSIPTPPGGGVISSSTHASPSRFASGMPRWTR